MSAFCSTAPQPGSSNHQVVCDNHVACAETVFLELPIFHSKGLASENPHFLRGKSRFLAPFNVHDILEAKYGILK
jgi:hypothetical protein